MKTNEIKTIKTTSKKVTNDRQKLSHLPTSKFSQRMFVGASA